MSRLPVCLIPDPAEALPGYLLRVSEANGYPMSYLLGTVLDREHPSRMGLPRLDGIASLAGLTPSQVARLSLAAEDGSRGRIQLLGHSLTTADCRMNAPRVCPHCLSEKVVCSALWDLAQVTACPQHGTALLEVCQSCEEPLRWSRTGVCFCRCGADLRLQFVKNTATAAEVGLASVFRYKLLGGVPPSSDWDHLKPLDLYGLCRLTWVLSGVANDPWGQNKLVRSRATLGKLGLGASGAMLADWPTGFQAFLDGAYRPELENGPTIPQFRQVFRWALDRLDQNFADRRDMVRLVVAEVYKFGSQFWSRTKLGDASGFELVLPAQFRWGSMLEAADLTGLQMGTLRKRISAGEVPVRYTTDSKPTRAAMVDLDWARNRKRSVNSLGLRGAARYVGLPIHTLRALRTRNDVYQQTHHGEFAATFAVEDLDDMVQTILNLASPKLSSAPPGAVSLRTLFDADHEWGADQKVEMIAAIRSGNITTLGHVDHSILGVVVERSAAVALLAALVTTVGTITLLAAGQALGTSAETVRGLVDFNYLERTERLGREQISAESLAEFQKNYVVLGSIVGSRSRHLAKSISEGGVELVELQMPRYKCWLIPSAQVEETRELIDWI